MAGDSGCTGGLFDVVGGDGGEQINIEADDDTEVEPVKRVVDPGKPTEQQIEEHRMTHLPYRTVRGADGAFLAVDEVYSTERVSAP